MNPQPDDAEQIEIDFAANREEAMAEHPYYQPVSKSKDVPFLGEKIISKHVSAREALEQIDSIEL